MNKSHRDGPGEAKAAASKFAMFQGRIVPRTAELILRAHSYKRLDDCRNEYVVTYEEALAAVRDAFGEQAPRKPLSVATAAVNLLIDILAVPVVFLAGGIERAFVPVKDALIDFLTALRPR